MYKSTNTMNQYGVGIAEKMRQQKAGANSSSLEKHEYTKYENNVVPFSLYFESPDKMRLLGGDSTNENEVKTIPENLFNKLFFSVANETDSKSTTLIGGKKQKTRKNKK